MTMTAGDVTSVEAAYLALEPPRARAASDEDATPCKTCHAGPVVLRDGHLVCCSCDAVNSRHYDARPEWRSGMDVAQSDLARCGVEASDLYTHSILGCTSTGADGRRAPRAASWGGSTIYT